MGLMNTKLLQVVLPQHSEGSLPGTLSIHSRQRTFDEPEEQTKGKQQPMLAYISNNSMTYHQGSTDRSDSGDIVDFLDASSGQVGNEALFQCFVALSHDRT